MSLTRALGRASVFVATASVATLAQAALVVDYPDFSDTTGLTINGNAARVGDVLRVTPDTFSQAGSAFSTNTVSLASGAAFSTYFQFRFTNPGGACDGMGCGADGIVFTVQTVANNVGGGGGGRTLESRIALESSSTTGSTAALDSAATDAGVDLNGSVASVVSANISEADLNDGDIWNAWVDYNSVTDLLEVRLTRSAVRPGSAILSYTVDRGHPAGSTDAYVGFTSGTGAAFANHDILLAGD